MILTSNFGGYLCCRNCSESTFWGSGCMMIYMASESHLMAPEALSKRGIHLSILSKTNRANPNVAAGLCGSTEMHCKKAWQSIDRPPAYWLRGMIRKRRFWAFPSSQFRCLFVRIKIGLSKIWWFPSACWIRHASRRLASAWYIGQVNTTNPSA